MPTINISGALLALSGPNNDGPWSWETWRSVTALNSAPFSENDPPPNWTTTTVSAVRSFANNFWNLPEDERIGYMRRRTDNDAVGRNAWSDLIVNGWNKGWKIHEKISKLLVEHKVHPYMVMKRLGVSKLPDLASAQAYVCHPSIANALFGEDAFDASGTFLTESVRKFVDIVMINTWQRFKKSLKRETCRLGLLRTEVDQLWQQMVTSTTDGQRPSKTSIRKWLNKVEALNAILVRYGDSESVAELSQRRQVLSDMLDAVGLGGEGRDKMRLPKALREALEVLASEQQVGQLTNLIEEQIRASRHDFENDPALELDLNRAPVMEWSDGVEDYRDKTVDELWSILGFSDKHIPFLNRVQDPNGSHDPWNEKDREWFKEPANTVPFGPRWHQLVGSIKMLECAFKGLPALLMDEVGLGKTLQITILVAVLAYYREYYKQHSRFPGAFAHMLWKGQPGNIPDAPFVFVVPVSLTDQITLELHRYLDFGSFDVLPYLGTWNNRKLWWTNVWPMAKNSVGRRIVITTPTALQSDFDYVLEADCKKPTLSPRQKASFLSNGTSTLYGRRFLVAAIDEAHNCRNVNKAYWAAFALREITDMVVAMTATPVTTRPLDLWNLGRCLGIEAFGPDADHEAITMERELRAAQRRDRKARQNNETNQDIVRGIVTGQAIRLESEYESTMLQWISKIRERFARAVIRRTIYSVDNTGARISGLRPFQEHLLVVDLYPAELENLDTIAKDMVLDVAHSATKFATGGDFYLRIRRALLHRSCNSNHDWHNPTTIEEWRKDPSRKLDVLVEILQYHLACSGRPPLHVCDNKLVPTSLDPVEPQATPDKLVVYVAFPSSNLQLLAVLKVYGVQAIELHGKMNPRQRTVILDSFRNGGVNDPRVLVMSNVGLIGLNLQCANLMVVMDMLWSAQDDNQLRGRIWRWPQSKQVHIYRLVAANTQDVFLNNISFDKAAIHNAFTGTTPNMRALFVDPSDKPDSDDEPDSDEEPSSTPMPKAKAKSGAKSRGNGPRSSKEQVKSSRQGNLLPANDNRDVTPHCQVKGKAAASQIEAKDGVQDIAISPANAPSLPLVPAPITLSPTSPIIPSDAPIVASPDLRIAASGADTPLFDEIFDFTPDPFIPEDVAMNQPDLPVKRKESVVSDWSPPNKRVRQDASTKSSSSKSKASTSTDLLTGPSASGQTPLLSRRRHQPASLSISSLLEETTIVSPKPLGQGRKRSSHK